MWESHYLFSNKNFNSASALRISILIFSSLKNLIIFFKIQPSLDINNNIIQRMKISISNSTESNDKTKFSYHIYIKNEITISSVNFNAINQ